MSYARFGWDGSDVYVFGTIANGIRYIECCSCSIAAEWRHLQPEDAARLTPEAYKAVARADTHWGGGPYEWNFGEPQLFTTKAAAVSHLRDHVAAGHTVPDYAFEGIEADDWVP